MGTGWGDIGRGAGIEPECFVRVDIDRAGIEPEGSRILLVPDKCSSHHKPLPASRMACCSSVDSPVELRANCVSDEMLGVESSELDN